MAAISDNKYDVYNWVKSIFESCQTLQQWTSAENLKRLFYKQYQDRNLEWELDSISNLILQNFINIKDE
jgi:hypothetical protein